MKHWHLQGGYKPVAHNHKLLSWVHEHTADPQTPDGWEGTFRTKDGAVRAFIDRPHSEVTP